MKRIIPGLVLALCWLLLLIKGTFLLFGVVILLTALIGGYEYLQMSVKDECDPAHSYILSALFSLPVLEAVCWPGSTVGGTLFLSFALLTCYVLYRYRELDNSYEFFCRLILGLIYVGFLISHLVLLRGLPDGNGWLVILAGVTAGSDTGAYFCGRAFGSHKLCPHVSPNKTIEGALGGLVAGVLVAALLALWLLPSVNLLLIIALAVPLTGAGIIGDLCESVIKRGTGTKDSGKILQGHGGILDRIDSMLFAGPVLYYLLVIMG